MKALVFEGLRAIRHADVPDSRLVATTDALVRVERAAICGSDLHVYHGRERGLDPGTVMGHEFVGQVVETGSDIRRLRRGDLVFSPFSTSCGRCFFCREGLTARCAEGQLFGWVQGGRGLQGAQAELVRVPLADSTLVPVPEGLPGEHALLVGDVLSTGYHCALQAGVRPGGTYAVVGCGPVGLMALLAAVELGAERVFAVDAIAARLSLAARFGGQPIDLGRTDPVRVVRDATEGRGVEAVLEAVGSPEAHRTALDLVRPGGTISVVGVHTEAQFAFTPAELYDRNLTYRVGRCPARGLFESVVPLARKRAAELDAILTHRLALSQGPAGYELFDSRLDRCVKVLLLVQEPLRILPEVAFRAP
jgi:threonine dehydrogenase-like Zn-dependent dehydrogenase